MAEPLTREQAQILVSLMRSSLLLMQKEHQVAAFRALIAIAEAEE